MRACEDRSSLEAPREVFVMEKLREMNIFVESAITKDERRVIPRAKVKYPI